MKITWRAAVGMAVMLAARGLLACPLPTVGWTPNPVCVGCQSELTLGQTEVSGFEVVDGPWIDALVILPTGESPTAEGEFVGTSTEGVIQWSAPGYCTVVVTAKLDWVRTDVSPPEFGRSTNISVTPFVVARMETFTITNASNPNNSKVDTTDSDATPTDNRLYIGEDLDGQAEVLMNLNWIPEAAAVGQIFTWEIEDGADWSPASGNFSGGQAASVWTNPDPGGAVDREFTVTVKCACGEGGECGSCTYRRMLKVVVLKVDLDTDIDNDRDIDDSDEPLEETGIGEVVRVDDTDDSPGGEDDLQYMQVKIEPTLTQGVVWFTYDTAKVKIWKDLAQTQPVNSGSEASPNWNLGAGDTVPDHVYVEGLATTAQGSSINIVLHVKVGGTECTDTILTTVTDQVGHYAYFAGVRDYLTEYRGPGVAEYKVFRDEVDASGGTDKDFWLVAVRLEKAALTVHDAYSPNPKHTSITAVMGANPNAAVIVNGTFWDAADFGVADCRAFELMRPKTMKSG